MHRRLVTAASWFTEDLIRRPPFGPPPEPREGRLAVTIGGNDIVRSPNAGRPVDVLLTSDALNLNDFLRQSPGLRRAARVVYVHDHGESAVPAESGEYDFCPRPAGIELVSLFNATAVAREPHGQLWFATGYHAAAFLMHVDELFTANSGMFPTDPRLAIENACRVVPPPVDDRAVAIAPGDATGRRRIVAWAGAANGLILKDLFKRIGTRGEAFELLTIGRIVGLKGVPHRVIDPADEAAVALAIASSRTYLAAGREVWFDPMAVRALRHDRWPLVPGQGRESSYDEWVPVSLQAGCFHDNSPQRIMNLLQTVWHSGVPEISEAEKQAGLGAFDPAAAVAAMDERLDRLAAMTPAAS